MNHVEAPGGFRLDIVKHGEPPHPSFTGHL